MHENKKRASKRALQRGGVARKISEIDVQLDKLAGDRDSLDKRLSFLLDDDDLAMARSFKDEYKRRFSALNDEERELQRKKNQLQLLLKQLRETTSKHSWLEQVNKALSYLNKKDMMSLRSTYRQIFEKIVVRRLDEAKVRLQFFFNTPEITDEQADMQRASKRAIQTSLAKQEVANCMSVGLVDCTCQGAKSKLNHLFSMELDSCITSSFIPEGVLRQKYLADRLSMRQIASEFSCSKTYVRRLLLKYVIPRRKMSDYRGSRWHAYGKRRVNGKTIDHQGEQRTIATIKQMYGEGMNTSAIARCLNAMKLPTKQRGRGWHQNTVATILKREGVYVVGR